MRTLVYLALLIFLVAPYALRRGGGPERAVAIVLLIGSLVTIVAVFFQRTGFRGFEPYLFVIDVVAGLALIVIALRANRQWPTWVAALQFISLAAHIARALDAGLERWTYQILLYAPAWIMLPLIAAGTYRHVYRLRRFGVDASWRTSSVRLRVTPTNWPAH